jgi:FG-GAP-like repeat
MQSYERPLSGRAYQIRRLHIGAAMQITLIPDSSIASAPESAELTDAVEAAAAVFEHDFPGNYNINISYGWGTFDNTPSDELTNMGSGVFSLGGSSLSLVSYTELKGWLTANAASSAQLTAVASLPTSAAALPGDANSFGISPAEEKALGVFTGDSGAIDGSIGFNIGDSAPGDSADWEPAALTEIAHALGWDSIAQGGSIPDVADLFRYSSPGQRQWASGQPAYFSIDGGDTDLANFHTTFDQTLFTNLPTNDPLLLPFTSAATTLTSFDIEALSVIGFGVVSAPPPPPPPPPPRRFNAGGNSSDIVWQNSGGQASIWEMSGNSVVGGGPVSPNPGPSWTEVGTGDFTDDGHSDIVWQNASTDQVWIWEMNGNKLTGGGPVGPNPGPTWTEIGTGDFNDDGLSDILWQNANGQVSIWEMNGNAVIGGGPVSPNPGPAWKAIGTGDFNDDHHSDILWQNTNTGQLSIWEMSGTKLIGGGPISANPGPSWQAMGTGDFNDDVHSDILWRNTSTGQVSIWEMSGTNVIGGGPIASNPGLSWSAVGTGDFNHDGHSDILWQNANGQVSIWEMSGAKAIGGGPVASNPGPSWLAL